MPISKDYLKNHQYQNANNLSARQALFAYGTNPESLWNWVAKQYRVLPGSHILEVGCGSGEFWLKASQIMPVDCTVTLTDLSAGMLENIKKKVSARPNYQFEVADVEQLPYNAKTFDIVFAHMMLYHAISPERGISEIKRVLKASGYAGILLSGEDNMQPLFTLIDCENPRQATRFSAEMAVKILPTYFTTIKQTIYYNTLKVTEIEPIIDYIRSLSTMDEKSDEFYVECRGILTGYLKQHGSLTLPTSRHLFIVS